MKETTPLVRKQPAHVEAPVSPPCRGRSPKSIIFLLSVVVFFMSCSDSLSGVPSTRLLENNICRLYGVRDVTSAPIDERLCKTDELQSELAYMTGLLGTLEAMVGLLVAFPYGTLSDAIGRKPILLLSFAGFALSSAWTALVLAREQTIPAHTILFSPAFLFIGGGRCVTASALYSAVADVTTEENRATGFLTISFGSLLGSFVGPLLSSSLMQISSPWIPYLMSFAMILVGAFIMLFVPETLHLGSTSTSKEKQSYRVRHLYRYIAQLKESLDILRQPALAILLIVFLAPLPMSTATGQFLVRYISKRFDWSLAAAGYLLSVRGMVNMLLLLAILPYLSTVLRSRGRDGVAKDRTLAQLSAIAMAIGCLLMAGPNIFIVIGGLIVNTLGDGLAPLCRSVAASLVNFEHTAKLQTLIGIIELTSSLFAGPSLASLLSVGMDLQGPWLGLPYMGLAVFLSVMTFPLFLYTVPQSNGSPSATSDSDSPFPCLQDLNGDLCSLGSRCPHHAALSDSPV
ncbi:hypothetical protein HIM_03373 [Hirsutella minnesotensis 3608]|uniref:Major facilitator superfamily (MFS) profile domain-containing protein n=1 Tax=Hirsutella minnesotensis 3608 TaxID=1043627 RepID=A0A0F8A2J4_9HYPO|nr:hypothetical protein HIM_03373 [Hirsutella minnesotensis 3608]